MANDVGGFVTFTLIPHKGKADERFFCHLDFYADDDATDLIGVGGGKLIKAGPNAVRYAEAYTQTLMVFARNLHRLEVKGEG